LQNLESEGFVATENAGMVQLGKFIMKPDENYICGG
jgi:hypothetical protein